MYKIKMFADQGAGLDKLGHSRITGSFRGSRRTQH